MNNLDVFVLDDDRDHANLLGAILRLHFLGSTFHIFFNADQALLAAMENHPDVVISDLEMPGMSGQEFAKAMRVMCIAGQVPLLIAASGSSKALASATQQCVFDQFFLKPLDIKALVQLLKNQILNKTTL